ncbi:menadione-induced gene-6 [Trichoderma gamsii]|uniref:Menadione-induced gene-6 n=1 Tax=Trichoderma gamsii TaxID=398673 RepID=A0A2P4ZRR1_9HYPO|nr:menadione-induced gene-6 [Trichoderma gamsii]PON26972.1 menadione-induced gene-6 [Trichoderma gamsii]
MALPTVQKKWIIQGGQKGLEEIQLIEGPIPKVDDYGVLVKLHAAGLNPRDFGIATPGLFAFSVKLPVVGGSDGAGEVIAVGPKVTKWKLGDRVATLFNPGHQAGPITTEAYDMGGLGGTIDGTFQQYGMFQETWLVRIAPNLSYLEAASLSNAAVTAWNALYGLKGLRAGEWILVQGTGGVSLFAVQFAKAAGAKVVATTSSPAKGDLLKQLGADHVINYNENPDWGLTARALTPNGYGFDNIIEVGGTDTLSQSVKAIKFEGVISVIGALSGAAQGNSKVIDALLKICTFRGLHVGSRVQMEEMMAAIEANEIQPILDETVFSFEGLRDGLEYLAALKHVGKVVVKIV